MKHICGFDRAYMGRCQQEPASGQLRCQAHADIKCGVCGAPATHECSYTGQFVCGVPLCQACEGYEEASKPGGVWGFMNHRHRTKIVGS